MRFWVGVTDNEWFRFLSAKGLDEVNFWQPSATPPFRGAPVGMPFLFKLKHPHNHIAGGAYFVTYSTLPLTLAWEIFGEKNGAASLEALESMVAPLHRKSPVSDIGCTVLSNPFFLDPRDWLADIGWARSIVRGKMYDSGDPDGRAIWDSLNARFAPGGYSFEVEPLTPDPSTAGDAARYGNPVLVKPRLGQSSFRVLVTDAYKRRCAITGESTLLALEAAHIVPYSRDGEHDVQNGLLLRADFHRLFDAGLVSVTQELRVRVSPRIREAWFNGKAYYKLDNQPLSVVPDLPAHRPNRDRLDWHFRNRFQA